MFLKQLDNHKQSRLKIAREEEVLRKHTKINALDLVGLIRPLGSLFTDDGNNILGDCLSVTTQLISE